MNWIEWIGMTAGALTTLAFLPQVIQVWKTKSAKDISLGMFVLFCIGVALWLVYGLLIFSLSIIIANGVTFCLAFLILLFKLKYK